MADAGVHFPAFFRFQIGVPLDPLVIIIQFVQGRYRVNVLQRSVEGGLFVGAVFHTAGRNIVVAKPAIMVDTAGIGEDQLVKTAYGFHKSIHVAHALFVIFPETAVRIVYPRKARNGSAGDRIARHIVIGFVVYAGMAP